MHLLIQIFTQKQIMFIHSLFYHYFLALSFTLTGTAGGAGALPLRVNWDPGTQRTTACMPPLHGTSLLGRTS